MIHGQRKNYVSKSSNSCACEHEDKGKGIEGKGLLLWSIESQPTQQYGVTHLHMNLEIPP